MKYYFFIIDTVLDRYRIDADIFLYNQKIHNRMTVSVQCSVLHQTVSFCSVREKPFISISNPLQQCLTIRKYQKYFSQNNYFYSFQCKIQFLYNIL